MSTEQEQEVIIIQEEKDGSATIELPDSIPSPDSQHDDDSDEADDRARQKEMVVGGAVDADAGRFATQKGRNACAARSITSRFPPKKTLN